MRIPVFVSRPSDRHLSPRQLEFKTHLYSLLSELELEPRTLGDTDYGVSSPLNTVLAIGRHCAGGLILGLKKETHGEPPVQRSFPTPWNHLEAGILFALRLPLLIFKEPGIDDGIFDRGTLGGTVHDIPDTLTTGTVQMRTLLTLWRADVTKFYYDLERR